MRFFVVFIFAVFSWAHVLNVNVPAPDYEILNDNLVVSEAAYMNAPGTPNVPGKTITLALPPGAIVESVEFHGSRIEIGECALPPARAPMPLGDHGGILKQINEACVRQKEISYASKGLFPYIYGRVIANGGLRKYTLITLVCYHFAYEPLTEKLYCSPSISVKIDYRMPAENSKRHEFWQGLKNDVTVDHVAKDLIYNWGEAAEWYETDSPERANGYFIIIPAALQSSVNTLVAYRQSQGYDVTVVTKEYIESNINGVDLAQKIRNFLRAHMSDIAYALLVGFSNDIPWRNMVPWNNDPDGPYDDPDISPIPSELYYAELTDPDSISWNSDGDLYWGEVYDANGQPNGDDNPDYHADIHLGRIPYSTEYVIEEICAKMTLFDSNTDISYKTASLLPAAMYYFENENNGGSFRLDGATFTEELLQNGILDSTNAVTLYEKAGIRPSIYPCTDSINRNNHISYWQNKGIMYECHHGSYNCYARKIWAWDDGDSIPENNEMSWPLSLHLSDVIYLNNDYPATTFLRSCLCGKPEVYSLGGNLLHHGSSAVISSSRIAWLSLADLGGIPYHFYERLMQDTTMSQGVIGSAYDLARNDFMTISGFWVIAYHYNLFGDPALRQFGRLTGIEELGEQLALHSFRVNPNPTSGCLSIELHPGVHGKIVLDVYDESGRYVARLHDGYLGQGAKPFNLHLPAGIYFIKMSYDDTIAFQKVVLVK